jgi:hypothetical protein
LKLSEGSGGMMTLDLCFVVDVTGSMQPWLSSVKGILAKITHQIGIEIANAHPSLVLSIRFAGMGYRDVGDSPQFEKCDFQHRSPAKSRDAVLQQNNADATRVATHVRQRHHALLQAVSCHRLPSIV